MCPDTIFGGHYIWRTLCVRTLYLADTIFGDIIFGGHTVSAKGNFTVHTMCPPKAISLYKDT
jgi:hypothetical protein